MRLQLLTSRMTYSNHSRNLNNLNNPGQRHSYDEMLPTTPGTNPQVNGPMHVQG